MVVRLMMGGRSLTEDEVLFRHQLLKLIQREKLKRSVHRSFAPGKLFGSSEVLNRKEGAFHPHVLSNPLYNSAASPPHVSDPCSSYPPDALPTKQENEGEVENAVPRERSRSKTQKGSLLQLMRQSRGSLKQLFSKEGMGEDGAIEGKEGASGKDRKEWKNQPEEAPLVVEDPWDKQSLRRVSPRGKCRQISFACSVDAKEVKPVVLKPVKHFRGSSPQKSGRVSPVLTNPRSDAEPQPMDEAEVVKQQVSADVSLQNNSPRKGSSENLITPSASPAGIPSLYSEENLQERFSIFVEISLKDGIVASRDQKHDAREQESAEAHDESLTNKGLRMAQEVSCCRGAIVGATISDEENLQQCGFNKKKKNKSGSSTPSTPLKSLFSGRGTESPDEPLSQQMVQDHSDSETGQPHAVDLKNNSQTCARSKTGGRRGKMLAQGTGPRPLRKLLNRTMFCRCDLDSIS